MITSLGAEAVERAQAIAQQADIVAALTLEVLKGTTKAFDSGAGIKEKNHKTGWKYSPETCGCCIGTVLPHFSVSSRRYPLVASPSGPDRGGATIPLSVGL